MARQRRRRSARGDERQRVPRGTRPARRPRPRCDRRAGARPRKGKHASVAVRANRPLVGKRHQRRTARGRPLSQPRQRLRTSAAGCAGGALRQGRRRRGSIDRRAPPGRGNGRQHVSPRAHGAAPGRRGRRRRRSRRAQRKEPLDDPPPSRAWTAARASGDEQTRGARCEAVARLGGDSPRVGGSSAGPDGLRSDGSTRKLSGSERRFRRKVSGSRRCFGQKVSGSERGFARKVSGSERGFGATGRENPARNPVTQRAHG